MDLPTVNQFIDGLREAFEAGDADVGTKAAEGSHLELVQVQYRALARGDMTAFMDLLAEDIELENIGPAAIPFVGRWQGRKEVAEAVARNFSCVEIQKPELLSVVAQGDTVVVFGREQGRFRPTGRPYDLHWVQQYTFKDGKLLRFRQVFDSAVMLEAVTGGPVSDSSPQEEANS